MRKQILLLLVSVLIFIVPLVLQIYSRSIPLIPLWLILLFLIYVAYQYLALIKPRFPRLDEVTDYEDIVETLLGCVRDELYSLVNGDNDTYHLSGNDIRVNIMLPIKDGFGNFRALKQLFSLGDYVSAEIQDLWKKGEGNCGMAWEEARQLVYPEYDQPLHSLSPDKRQRHEDIRSIISTPIRITDHGLIGVLNFDSNLELDKTHFADESVKSFAKEKTHLFERLLPRNGIKGKDRSRGTWQAVSSN